MSELHDRQLTPRQLALLHVAKERLGLEEDTYRDLLELSAGVRSARELDAEGFQAVLRRLRRLGFHPRPRDGLPARPGLATEAQLAYLIGLWHRYTGRPDERGLSRWLRKQTGLSDPQRLDRAAVHKALVALKAMVARHGSPRNGTHG